VHDRAINLEPDYDGSWAQKGLTLVALKKYDEAISNFDRALGLNPRNEQAWNGKLSVL